MAASERSHCLVGNIQSERSTVAVALKVMQQESMVAWRGVSFQMSGTAEQQTELLDRWFSSAQFFFSDPELSASAERCQVTGC